MANKAEQAAGSQKAGKEGMTRRKFLEIGVGLPLFMFGSMLAGIFKKEQLSKFVEEAMKTATDFFSAPVAGKGSGGGKSGSGEQSKAG